MQRLGRVSAASVGVVAVAVVVGWYADVPELKSVLPGYGTMKPNTALAFIALAVAVSFPAQRRTALVLGACVSTLGAVSLAQVVLGLGPGFDVLLPAIRVVGDGGLMAPATAVSLLLLGSAVIAGVLGRTRWLRVFALAAFAVGQVATLGYAYGVSSLYTVGGLTRMAVHTTACVMVLSLSILLLDPSGCFVGLFGDRRSVGRLVRPLVPFLLIGPSLLGGVQLWAQEQGWFDTTFGVSFLVMSMTVLGGTLTWRAAMSLGELDRERDAAVLSLAASNGRLESAVVERTREAAQRQAFLDALLETVDVGIVSCDAAGTTLVRNRAERAMAGLDLPGRDQAFPELTPELIGLDGRQLTPEQFPLARALSGERVPPVELLFGPAGGPHRDVVVRADRILGQEDEFLGAVVSITDVTLERRSTRALEVEHRNLQQAQRIGQLGSFEYDYTTCSWSFSEQFCILWGVEPGAFVPDLFGVLVHEADAERARESWQSTTHVGGSHSLDYRIRRADDGVERLIRCSFQVQLGPDGRPLTRRGTHLDITEVTAAQVAAQEATAFLEAVMAATPDYTFVLDVPTGAIVYGSPGKQILGRSGEELQAMGSEVMTILHAEDAPRLEAANLAAAELDPGQVVQLLYRGQHTDGQMRWLSRRVTPFRRDAEGTVVQLLGVTRDVTEVVQAEDHLRYLVVHDSLTGLPNRALLVDRLDAALARSEQDGREVAVLYIDLDGFKRVNDTAGHAAGDAVLVETAQRLRAAMRPEDTVARVGGDEFVIVLEAWDRPGPLGQSDAQFPRIENVRDLALQVVERVTEALCQPVEIHGIEHVVTASIGIAYATSTPGRRADPVTSNEVLQDADAAMYRAKGRGKNRFEVFEHGLRSDLAERGRIEQVLRQALRQAQVGRTHSGPPLPGPRERTPMLAVAYQPVFCSDNGALLSFEALARLTDADDIDIPPDQFIRVAEDVGLIRAVGAVILDRACGQLAAWRAGTPGLDAVTMAVNVSALQAQHASLGADIQLALDMHRLPASALVLELTETALLHAAHATITTLRGLRNHGVGIAIDDFGTGYASLRYLATLPVTAVKIDRSFVTGLPNDETSRKIVKAVAGLAADMDLDCIVEGVETDIQRLALPSGVQLQGWLTGRPALPDKLDLLNLVTFGAPHFTRPDSVDQ